MVTMNDVARAAGVSVMTVSNVLNGRPNVSTPTRDRVLEVVSDLGYQMNLTARHLRAGRTDSIAMVVPNFNGYFGELADDLTHLLQDSGRHLVLESTSARPDAELQAFSMARLRMHDAAIISVSGLSADEVARLRPLVPVVLLGEREMPDDLDHLQLDNVTGARIATEHLISRGATRIAMLGGSSNPEHDMSYRRRCGWQEALEAAGLEHDAELVATLERFSPSEAHGALKELRARTNFDGLFCATDTAAQGAVAALHDAGLRVPEDVQVVGFDNLASSRFSPPCGLTSVGPELGELPRRVLAMLERRMSDPDAPPQHVVLPLHLFARGTTR